MTVQAPLARMEEFAPINLMTILVDVQTGGQEKIAILIQMTVQASLARMEESAPINLQTILVDVQMGGQEKIVKLVIYPNRVIYGNYTTNSMQVSQF